MGRKSKSLGLVLLLIFSTSLVALPRTTEALAPYVILSATAITKTTVTLSWTNSDFTANSFTSYTLYISTASNYANGHPFTPIWSTSDRQQTTTIVNNLAPSSKYYFYILDSGFGGQADSSNLLEVQTKPNPTPSPSSTTSYSAPAIEWQNEYSNDRTHDNTTESVSNLIQTNDGGYAFMDLGWTHGVAPVRPATLYKVDYSGKIQWQKTIDYFIGQSLIQTNDYGYELAGEWNTYGTTYLITPALLKTDSNGNIQWYVNYTSITSFNVSNSQIQTSDGGFAYVSGSSLIKADSNNQTQWTKELRGLHLGFGTYGVMLFSLVETSDGAIAVLGVDNPAYGENVWGTIYMAKTQPFLPLLSPTTLQTPIPTPIITVSQPVLTQVIVALALAIALVAGLLLYRWHRKPAILSR